MAEENPVFPPPLFRSFFRSNVTSFVAPSSSFPVTLLFSVCSETFFLALFFSSNSDIFPGRRLLFGFFKFLL